MKNKRVYEVQIPYPQVLVYHVEAFNKKKAINLAHSIDSTEICSLGIGGKGSPKAKWLKDQKVSK